MTRAFAIPVVAILAISIAAAQEPLPTEAELSTAA
jgi:hypothetical protein